MYNPANEILEQFKLHAQHSFPNECCGIINKGKYIEIENISDTPTSSFMMAPSVWKKYPKLEAVLHSHPDGDNRPSDMDMKMQMQSAVPWGLTAVNSSDLSCTTPYFFGTFDCSPPLVGRDFRHGPSGTDNAGDCYALIRDYFHFTSNLDIPEFPRQDGWWNKPEFNLYEDNFRSVGFSEVSSADVKAGDVFFACILSSKINHAGIYIGNGLMLHHLSGRLSTEEPIGRWIKHIKKWVRYHA